MPKSWHDRHSVNKIEDESTKDFYRSIVADKKPYFMRYIYPALMKQYNTYIKNTNKNALREFQLTVPEMKNIPYGSLSERQQEFLRYYDYKMPVGTGNCVMNKICRRFEAEFDGYIRKHSESLKFDYRIMRNTSVYTTYQYNTILRLYKEYNKRLNSYAIFANYERVDECDSYSALSTMNEDFKKECSIACPDKNVLCNIILDICYSRSSTKRFAWSMCGTEIIENLLANNEYMIHYPTIDEDGEIEYCGNKFTIETAKIGVSK